MSADLIRPTNWPSSRRWPLAREVNVEGIAIEGIEAITLDDIRNASELGYKIKLLGVAVTT